ncbi:MAG: heavy-metal-associated domain-containing protein [Bacteriovoracaceae bacterium]|nr:heavy-metal-associated domain-containing protein [Bacteriovoracaceae bacterium]
MSGIVFTVEGMKCGGCKTKIENSLVELNEEITTLVNLENKTVVVNFENPITPLEVKKTIEEAGFNISKMESAE